MFTSHLIRLRPLAKEVCKYMYLHGLNPSFTNNVFPKKVSIHHKRKQYGVPLIVTFIFINTVAFINDFCPDVTVIKDSNTWTEIT